MLKRLGVLALAVVLLAGACGNDDNDKEATATTAASGSAATYQVGVDGKAEGLNAFYLAYFPKAVTVHPGAEVDFTSVFTGEPHTVTFGTLVDAGLAAADKLGPDAQDEPAELKKIPPLLPDGPGDAIQSSAQPCFLDSGDPPPADACAKVDQPEFTGKQSIFSSGFLADGEVFKVKLADDIAPGTYRYFCELHRAGMQGEITVVADDAKADTPAEAKAAGESELAAVAAKLKPAAEKLTTLTADTAQAGASAEDAQEAGVTEFGPKDLSVPVGGSVTWDVQGPHTVTFGASEALRTFISRAPDGAVHVNPESFAPAGGPGSDGAPPEKPTVYDGGSWDGTGLRSSGLILGFGPPGTAKFKLTFAKAGTYTYECLIHPDMEGTVKVG